MEGSLAKRSADLLIVDSTIAVLRLKCASASLSAIGALEAALRRLVDAETVREGMIVGTCNRVEIITSTTDVVAADEKIKSFLAETQGSSRCVLRSTCIRVWAKTALGHLFRVAASLDSLVVGEPQFSAK